jgi:hypothetical protein
VYKPNQILLVQSGARSSQSIIEFRLDGDKYQIRHQLGELFNLDVYLEIDPSKKHKKAIVSINQLGDLLEILEQIKIPLSPSSSGGVDGGYTRLRIDNAGNVSELKWFSPYSHDDWDLEELVSLIRATVAKLLYGGTSLDDYQ